MRLVDIEQIPDIENKSLMEFPIRNDIGKFFQRLIDSGHQPVAIVIKPNEWDVSVLTTPINGELEE